MSLQFGIHTPGQVCTLQMSSASFCCYIDAYVSDISDEISEALLHCYLNYATSRSRHASRHTRDLKSGAKYYYSTSVIFLSLGPIFGPSHLRQLVLIQESCLRSMHQSQTKHKL
jgi:hypothetical protein